MTSPIIYLASEFPGQTHVFLWRELRALAQLGVKCELMSTRRPSSDMMVHSWAKEAEKRTTYLVPFSVSDLAASLFELISAGPLAWWRCLSVAVNARDLSPKDRARLLLLTLPAAKLSVLARKTGITHIHAPYCADSANIALLALKLSPGLTYSLELLGPTLESYGGNQPQKWGSASFGLVMSELLLADVKKKLAGSLPATLRVAPVGVDIDEVKRSAPYEPWQPGTLCRIYSCGRLNPVKGHCDLLEAIALLRERGIDVHLSIAGTDDNGGQGYRREVEAAIAKHHLTDRVTLLGAVPEEEHRRQLEAAHVFALASLNEGISVAIMEAMAMEMPVVVTAVGGNHELISNGDDALMVPAQQPVAMADALERVLRDPGLAMRLVGASRRKVVDKFDYRIGARTLVDCLNRNELHGAGAALAFLA